MTAVGGADVAVYTCILPYQFTALKTPIYINEDRSQVHYWAITDFQQGIYPWWDYVVERDPELTSRRDLQKYKMLSHLYLPEYAYTVWVDGDARLKVDPLLLVDLLKESGKSLAFGTHPWRDCSYDEGRVCAGLKQNSAEIINAQLARYREEGFPEHYGLCASTFFVRDNRDPEACAFFELWLDETMKGSHRNQISFGFAAWKLGIDILWWEIPWGDNEYWTHNRNL